MLYDVDITGGPRDWDIKFNDRTIAHTDHHADAAGLADELERALDQHDGYCWDLDCSELASTAVPQAEWIYESVDVLLPRLVPSCASCAIEA